MSQQSTDFDAQYAKGINPNRITPKNVMPLMESISYNVAKDQETYRAGLN